MDFIANLKERRLGDESPIIIDAHREIYFTDILDENVVDLSQIKSGDIVALIGDFEPKSILLLIKLIEMRAIIVPLTVDTEPQHEYFFETAFVDYIVKNNKIIKRQPKRAPTLIDDLRETGNGGLVLFTTGTTGQPKAILHDMALFLQRFETRRPALKTLSFLLFDHIGGINTLLHTLFNAGTVVTLNVRTVEEVLRVCENFDVELLPTTPTFLRLLLISGAAETDFPTSLKIITYGTEKMDQPTLDELCRLLPEVDFRQTFGMSELGIVRVRSKARNSLFMKIGGEGIQTRVKNNVLEIKSKTAMLGYLNADSPFDSEGWYNTKDIVEERDGFYKVVGRSTEVINVGGLKFMPADIEEVASTYDGVALTKATSRDNPITGQHVELIVQPTNRHTFDKMNFKRFLQKSLPKHMHPARIKIDDVAINSRFKKS